MPRLTKQGPEDVQKSNSPTVDVDSTEEPPFDINTTLYTLVAAVVDDERDARQLEMFIESALAQQGTHLRNHVFIFGVSCVSYLLVMETLKYVQRFDEIGWLIMGAPRAHMTAFEIYKYIVDKCPALDSKSAMISLARGCDLIGPHRMAAAQVASMAHLQSGDGVTRGIGFMLPGKVYGGVGNESAADITKRIRTVGLSGCPVQSFADQPNTFLRGDAVVQFFKWATPRLLTLNGVWGHYFHYLFKIRKETGKVSLFGNGETTAGVDWFYVIRCKEVVQNDTVGFTEWSPKLIYFRTLLPAHLFFLNWVERELQMVIAFCSENSMKNGMMDEVLAKAQCKMGHNMSPMIGQILVRYVMDYILVLEKKLPAEYQGYLDKCEAELVADKNK